MHSTKPPAFVVRSFTLLALLGAPLLAQSGMTGGEWTAYSGDKGSTKYSALSQIDRGNAKDLEVAWTWETPDNAIRAENPRMFYRGFTATPLFADGVLYTTTGFGIVAALDPTNGTQKWAFDPEVYKSKDRPTNLGFNMRGIAYWEDDEGRGRILHATNRANLYAIDLLSGEPIGSFGDQGKVDLVEAIRRPLSRRNVSNVSPALVCGDTVILGSSINDRPTMTEMTPGDVRAYDVRTGEHKWTFNNPPAKGEVGYDTWEDGSAETAGNSNVWTHMSCDEELGLVYLPFGTGTNDFYGGHRKGKNLFAESLVAVKAETGELVWYFQVVHHGVWDYDLPAAPALVDVTVDGKERKALAQVTKQGFLFVLDRTTGEGVWPIEERPVPPSNVPGEKLWPTQPFPTKPAPFNYQGSTPDLLIDFTPELKAEALKILEQYNYGPLYLPPLEESEGKHTIISPSYGGGANWQGCAVDPETGIVYVPSVNGRTNTFSMAKPDAARSNFDRIATMGPRLQGPDGLPLFKPPYSHVTAIDLETGDHIWDTPLGDGPIDHPRLKDLDLPPMGDNSSGFVLATKTLLFAAQGGQKPTLRALDKATGEIVAEIPLQAPASGSPMTYMHDGRQYIVLAAGSGFRGQIPSQLIALALPQE